MTETDFCDCGDYADYLAPDSGRRYCVACAGALTALLGLTLIADRPPRYRAIPVTETAPYLDCYDCGAARLICYECRCCALCGCWPRHSGWYVQREAAFSAAIVRRTGRRPCNRCGEPTPLDRLNQGRCFACV